MLERIGAAMFAWLHATQSPIVFSITFGFHIFAERIIIILILLAAGCDIGCEFFECMFSGGVISNALRMTLVMDFCGLCRRLLMFSIRC